MRCRHAEAVRARSSTVLPATFSLARCGKGRANVSRPWTATPSAWSSARSCGTHMSAGHGSSWARPRHPAPPRRASRRPPSATKRSRTAWPISLSARWPVPGNHRLSTVMVGLAGRSLRRVYRSRRPPAAPAGGRRMRHHATSGSHHITVHVRTGEEMSRTPRLGAMAAPAGRVNRRRLWALGGKPRPARAPEACRPALRAAMERPCPWRPCSTSWGALCTACMVSTAARLSRS
mmetsp:Transcript_63428/g.163215  ORF Transcript_63428/g.163215 Transcript_63428/m.163215 type:complete len:234 (+) Transcript_63428:409-1110(+)